MEYCRADVRNAFGASVYHVVETTSTMEEARRLAAQGESDGTAIYADYQRAGRGRLAGRTWEAEAGENLLCTVILRRKAVRGFTLRVGLAVARTLDCFLPEGIRSSIKWPNDVLIGGKKAAGILCESYDDILSVGCGINITQRVFPAALASRATSLALALESEGQPPLQVPFALPSVETVLERYLDTLSMALSDDSWKTAVSGKLWRRGERITFLSGDPSRNESLDGYIEGIGDSGELIFRPADTNGNVDPSAQVLHLYSGEFPY